jgi:hypothetical protein
MNRRRLTSRMSDVSQPERNPTKKMSSAARAAPKHIPLAINRTTSIVWNVAKRGLLTMFEKAASPMDAMKRGTNTFGANVRRFLIARPL